MRSVPFPMGGTAAILERRRRAIPHCRERVPRVPGADRAMSDEPSTAPIDRRVILKGLAAAGIGTATFRRSLAAQAEQAGRVSPEMIKQAEWIAGLELSDKEREGAARSAQRSLEMYRALRAVDV